jgi:preprotein translocase subunit YajC
MSSVGLLFIFIAFGFLYFVLVRPQRRRRVEQERLLSSVEEGDEILTAGGIYGTVTSAGDDDVTVEIAPGIEVRVARRAIAGIVPQEDEDEHDSDEDEPDLDEAPDDLEAPDADEEPDPFGAPDRA